VMTPNMKTRTLKIFYALTSILIRVYEGRKLERGEIMQMTNIR